MTAVTTDSTPVHHAGYTPPPRRIQRRWIFAALAAAIVIAIASLTATDPFSSNHPPSNVVIDNGYPTSLVRVKYGALSSQVVAQGTLGYIAEPDGSPYSVVSQALGVYTSLPQTGQTISQGQVLYSVSNNPIVLLDGNTPAYRGLGVGANGPDVAELNADLVALGYANGLGLDPSTPHFSAQTETALKQLQAHLGVPQTGSLAFGQAVFLPGPIRITKVTAALGADSQPGSIIAQATSTRRQIEANIDATQQSSLAVGDAVLITLPNYQDTTGVVTGVGNVASSSGSTPPTIPVYIALDHPADAGSLDQAPVRVQITASGVSHAFIVPVTALLAQPGGGYAVEAVNTQGVHHLVPVKIGLFDDADGLVQVTGKGVFSGQQIVVPTR